MIKYLKYKIFGAYTDRIKELESLLAKSEKHSARLTEDLYEARSMLSKHQEILARIEEQVPVLDVADLLRVNLHGTDRQYLDVVTAVNSLQWESINEPATNCRRVHISTKIGADLIVRHEDDQKLVHNNHALAVNLARQAGTEVTRVLLEQFNWRPS